MSGKCPINNIVMTMLIFTICILEKDIGVLMFQFLAAPLVHYSTVKYFFQLFSNFILMYILFILEVSRTENVHIFLYFSFFPYFTNKY